MSILIKCKRQKVWNKFSDLYIDNIDKILNEDNLLFINSKL